MNECGCWQGEVATSHRIDVKSYTSLHTLVNDMFPPTSLVEQVKIHTTTTSDSCLIPLISVTLVWLIFFQEDYNSWNFWKVPLPEVEE